MSKLSSGYLRETCREQTEGLTGQRKMANMRYDEMLERAFATQCHKGYSPHV
jgi:hypothetical protein